jgi:hypothetical protein
MYGTPKKEQQQIKKDRAVAQKMLTDLQLEAIDKTLIRGSITGDYSPGGLLGSIPVNVQHGGRFQ